MIDELDNNNNNKTMTDENENMGLVESNTSISNDVLALKPKKPRKQRKVKPKLKARTLEEFKNWLEGLEEFQDEGWIPNAEQWGTIKGSIYLIKEEEYYDEAVTYPQPTAQQMLHPQQHQQQTVNTVPAPIQDVPLSATQIDDMVNKAKAMNGTMPQSTLPTATAEPTGTGDEFI